MESAKTPANNDQNNNEFLKCAVCLDFADNAVEGDCCHNVFCAKCLNNVKEEKNECPLCRRTDFQIVISYLARRMIAIFPVSCPYGCSESLIRGNLADHEKNCINRKYQCVRRGCKFSGDAKAYREHIVEQHTEDLIQAFEAWEKRKETKGSVTGYYVQAGQHPITGTYSIRNGELKMETNDDCGKAIWRGIIKADNPSIELEKYYVNGGYTVKYSGSFNSNSTEIQGKWYFYDENEGDQFKLTFID